MLNIGKSSLEKNYRAYIPMALISPYSIEDTRRIMSLSDNERWILSFYRNSEISGALFFGKLARSIRNPSIQKDLTKHFADEAQHAWIWSDTLQQVNLTPIRLTTVYQDRYLEAAGLPVNLMEVLAITQVFEKRVIGQYAKHRQVPGLNPYIARSFETIMKDEVWHIEWISEAIQGFVPEYGEDYVKKTLQRYHDADVEVYGSVLAEHAERLDDILKIKKK
jgi:hypothetical protein